MYLNTLIYDQPSMNLHIFHQAFGHITVSSKFNALTVSELQMSPFTAGIYSFHPHVSCSNIAVASFNFKFWEVDTLDIEFPNFFVLKYN